MESGSVPLLTELGNHIGSASSTNMPPLTGLNSSIVADEHSHNLHSIENNGELKPMLGKNFEKLAPNKSRRGETIKRIAGGRGQYDLILQIGEIEHR